MKAAERCHKCGGNNTTTQGPKRKNYYCRPCRAEYMREYWRNNQARLRLAGRMQIRRLKAEVIAAYGGQCACCGEREYAFLAVDHVFNDGAAHRRGLFGSNNKVGGSQTYRWLKKNGFPKVRFQILCHNCNFAKQLVGRCPHLWPQALLPPAAVTP